MSSEKQELIEKVSIQISGAPEYFGVRSPIVKAVAKYRKEHRQDPDSAPDIKYGGYCVVREYKEGKGFVRTKDIAGYYLCRILDWQESKNWYGTRTTIYAVVMESSFPAGDEMIGRLIGARLQDEYWLGNEKKLIGFSRKDFPPRRE